MRWWDVAAVTALEAELFAATAWSAEVFWAELAAPGRWYLVAEQAGGPADGPGGGQEGARVVGYGGLAGGPHEADVQTLAVAPAARGRGLGRLVLRALVERAGAGGAGWLGLEVAADNAAARALYASEGFTRLGVRRGYYQPGGTDALVLRRRLP